MLLLELKGALEGLSKRIALEETLTFTKFLLLTAVVLPVLPNQVFGPFEINPYKSWLVVVAVSSVSYGSYLIQKLTKGQGGVILAASAGGRLFVHGDHRGVGQTVGMRESAAPVFGWSPNRLGCHVFASGRAGNAV